MLLIEREWERERAKPENGRRNNQYIHIPNASIYTENDGRNQRAKNERLNDSIVMAFDSFEFDCTDYGNGKES